MAGVTLFTAEDELLFTLRLDELLVFTLRLEDELVFTLRLEDEFAFTLRLLPEVEFETLLEPDAGCTLRLAELAVVAAALDATARSGVLTLRLALEPDTARRSEVLRLKLRSHPAPLILRLGVNVSTRRGPGPTATA